MSSWNFIILFQYAIARLILQKLQNKFKIHQKQDNMIIFKIFNSLDFF